MFRCKKDCKRKSETVLGGCEREEALERAIRELRRGSCRGEDRSRKHCCSRPCCR
jgi:hypothetical protein